MDNTTALFIRACKSNYPIKRLNSVHRRIFSTKGVVEVTNELIEVLTGIAENHCNIDTTRMLSDLKSSRYFKKGSNPQQCHKEELMYAIRHHSNNL